MDREKNACPMAITQVFTSNSLSHFGTKRKLYPAEAPGRKNTRTARTVNRTKKTGIITRLARSIWVTEPVTRIITVIRTTARCQGRLPKLPVACAK